MRFLRFVLSRSDRARSLLIAAAAVGGLSGALSVALLSQVNRTLQEGGGGPPEGAVGLSFLVLCLLLTGSRILVQQLMAHLGQGMVKELRLALTERVLGAPLAQLEAIGPHRVLATLTDDIASLTQAMVIIPILTVNGTVVFGTMTYLAFLDWKMFLMLLVLVIVGVAGYQIPAQLAMARFRAAREQEDVLFGLFNSLTQGIKELKLHRERRRGFVGLVEASAQRMLELRVVAATLYGTAAAVGHMLFFLVIGGLLFARPSFIDADWAVLVSFTIMLLYLMTPMQAFLDAVPTLGRADVAVQKVERLGFDLGSQPEESPAQAVAPFVGPRIELVGVTHSYRREGQEQPFTLGPMDIALEPGQVVFLVGGNGSGKTTLAKVLVGLYKPEAGEVRVDGRVVGDEEREQYRELFSAVFSDFHLFDRFLGLEGAGRDEQARRYLEELRLAHKVKIEGGGVSTVDLSLGQRKRLALLTAYLENRPVYLFDEWAADQDPVFKEVFYRQILAELRRRGKTVIVISHDDRYFDAGDRILKMEDGQLVFDGPFVGMESELLAAHAPVKA